MISAPTKQRIRQVLEPEDRVVFAYLFGSSAAGSGRARDIDIAVYFDRRENLPYHHMKIDLYVSLSRALKRNDLDIVVLNTAGNLMLLEEIIRNRLVLIDRDRDLRNDFEQRILHQAIDFKYQRKKVMGF